MNIIKRLSEITINKIAAGEVIERPSAALKEIIENAIDADAKNIEIILEEAGKNLILVSDDGFGMNKEELETAIERHTTSKLDESDIMKIENFGFRGEALPSIGSVSRLTITSSHNGIESFKITIEGGHKKIIQKALREKGTTVEIRDLFFATPARLKFLRSDKQELSNCREVVKKIAMAYPEISFKLCSNSKELIDYRSKKDRKNRILEILGEDFVNNSSELNFTNHELNITGIVSLPTYHKGTSEDQYLFINNRPVKDKLLIVAVRIAYQDFIERGRHPMIILFLNIDPRNVDVNVHPSKTEVRFHDPNFIRQSIISSIKDALYNSSNRVSDTLSNKLGNILYENIVQYKKDDNKDHTPTLQDNEKINYHNKPTDLFQRSSLVNTNNVKIHKDQSEINSIYVSSKNQYVKTYDSMGSAICQIKKTYIIAQTEDSLLIIDQHAVHERLVYEKLKEQIKNNAILKQRLLMPEIIEFHDEKKMSLIEENKEELNKLGLVYEKFSDNSIIIREIPSLISSINIRKLIDDIIDDLLEFDSTQNIAKIQEHILETYACHHSIRAGRELEINEMDDLLRQMEQTPFSGQCNHGRPTYAKLQIKDIEKLLGRT
jgi:DNA mismatch repair protein MutL